MTFLMFISLRKLYLLFPQLHSTPTPTNCPTHTDPWQSSWGCGPAVYFMFALHELICTKHNGMKSRVLVFWLQHLIVYSNKQLTHQKCIHISGSWPLGSTHNIYKDWKPCSTRYSHEQYMLPDWQASTNRRDNLHGKGGVLSYLPQGLGYHTNRSISWDVINYHHITS